jgi:hypothetical protein
MEAKGIIHKIFETVQVSDKFRKREFVLVIDHTSPYPQNVSFQLTQDKVSLIDGYKPGEEVTVSFSLRGREWTSPQGETKYFNTIDAWRIQGGQSSPSEQPESSGPPQGFHRNDDDDLPF